MFKQEIILHITMDIKVFLNCEKENKVNQYDFDLKNNLILTTVSSQLN